MTSLPVVLDEDSLGIIISTPKGRAKPVRFWAYLWAADEDESEQHWHERVPVGRRS